MSDETNIIPCAHCGHAAQLRPYLGKWYVQCRAKDCHIRTEIYETKEQAIACWNRRVKSDDERS